MIDNEKVAILENLFHNQHLFTALSALINKSTSLDEDKLVILGDKDYYDQEIEEIKVQTIQIRKELSRHFLKNRMLELEQEISRIENSSKLSEEKSADVQNLMEEFRSLSEELKRVNQ